MRALVTGATGWVGEVLVARLAGDGVEVHALGRSERKAEVLRHPRVRVFLGDLLDSSALVAAMAGCTHVFHLAALASTSAPYPGAFDEVNVWGTRLVVDTALRLGVERLVHTSTAAVLGPSAGAPLTEE